jgi:hypothetical protein
MQRKCIEGKKKASEEGRDKKTKKLDQAKCKGMKKTSRTIRATSSYLFFFVYSHSSDFFKFSAPRPKLLLFLKIW